MRTIIFFLITTLFPWSLNSPEKEKTYCNPVNLNYRFQAGNNVSYREAADPTVITCKDNYFLFASHSGGYWSSDDLLNWHFIPVRSLPIEDYAPDVTTINDTTYYIASSAVNKPIYYNTDPFRDTWKPLGKSLPFPVWDPHFFVDDDGKRYLYWGCSDKDNQPIRVVRLNSAMQPETEPVVLIKHNPLLYGWENPGEKNEIAKNGYNEGPWLNKYKKRYYLQYASPGTEFKTYADGVYTSDSPMGPFKYESYSPFSYKPGGFFGGAGHGSTFSDKYGNYWHIATLSISQRHMFERRLALFPATFDKDGVLRTFTAFGDYPTIIPDHKIDYESESLFRGWMLLSYNKKTRASSSEDQYPPSNAADEDIRTWWSARTGDPGEYISMDLGGKRTVCAVQINFADYDSRLKPDDRPNIYSYRILASDDQRNWIVIVDKRNNDADACHDYTELKNPVEARYIKLENVRVPDGKFSLYDMRVFGLKKGPVPGEVEGFQVTRDSADSRRATVKWEKDDDATGYVINYGPDINKLYTSVMVYNDDSLRLTGLNKGVTYFFSIDAFNESGIREGRIKIKAE
jgi:xylan 1,4-beta-xylosidase